MLIKERQSGNLQCKQTSPRSWWAEAVAVIALNTQDTATELNSQRQVRRDVCAQVSRVYLGLGGSSLATFLCYNRIHISTFISRASVDVDYLSAERCCCPLHGWLPWSQWHLPSFVLVLFSYFRCADLPN